MRIRLFQVRFWKKLLIQCLIALSCFTVLFYCLCWLFPFPENNLKCLKERRISTLILDRQGNPLRAFRGYDDSWTFWLNYKEINPLVIQAIIAAEDGRFYYHPGVDPFSLLRAVSQNIWNMRRISGASTLTMQLMRVADPKARTMKHKLIESFRALQFEHSHSKQEILELYLNLAPYGGNFYGIEAASLIYLGKRSKDLSLSEAALLAGIPQSPCQLRPDRFPERAYKRRQYVLQRMFEHNYITRQEYLRASTEPITAKLRKLPFDAPHFCQMLKNRLSYRGNIQSTLDPYCQYVAQNVLTQQVQHLTQVYNGAVVVIENKSSAIRAFVGNVDFWDAKNCGQINAALALRSPGSTLKPFVYAIAFERKNCLPITKLPDAANSYSGYIPVNFDYKYRGPVLASECLRLSYNAPAVFLLNKVGLCSFKKCLEQCGISSLKHDAGYYGLPLVLGAGEVNLLELANAYTVFGRRGTYKPYKLLEVKSSELNRRIFSAGAAYMIAESLKQKMGVCRRPMAWKTGTSYGFHDAWTVAFTPKYTVGVWVGNLNNKSSTDLIGSKAAVPIAEKILTEIDRREDWFYKSDDLQQCTVCSVSGKLPGPGCKHKEVSYCLRNNRQLPVCNVHKLVRDKKESDKGVIYYEDRIIENWPAEFAINSVKRRRLATELQILSPAPNQIYRILAYEGMQFQKLQLLAKSSGNDLFWYIDGQFYAKTKSLQSAFLELKEGTHIVSCVTTDGVKAHVDIIVK